MKNQQVSVISHPELGQVRGLTIQNEPWFVAKDICDLLGIQNSSNSLNNILDKDERGVEKIYTPGGLQEMTIVNESGLYSLLMRSNKPNAKIFRKWVTSEVLPAIRRQGFYIHPSAELSKKEMQMLQQIMRLNVKQYIVSEDIRRCARRLEVEELFIQRVLNGAAVNNDVMLDLQTRALSNQQKWHNAYSVERMREVTDKLSKAPRK